MCFLTNGDDISWVSLLRRAQGPDAQQHRTRECGDGETTGTQRGIEKRVDGGRRGGEERKRTGDIAASVLPANKH